MKKYSYLDRILHDQFLGKTELSRYLYERLLENAQKYFRPSRNSHLFVTGLPRAGTTALLNQLYSTGEYASFCYKHMPFILSPRIAEYASKFSGHRKSLERSHKDGLHISLDSPECLDEVFWIKSDDRYHDNPLNNGKEYETIILKAYDYLLSEFTRWQKKYSILVKNNNNHIRLPQLSEHFPESLFLCIFRHPIHHSFSLRQAHNTFLRLHREDPYSCEYMRLIGHREFGICHERYTYGETTSRKFPGEGPEAINYWLSQWIETHSWFLESGLTNRNNIIWICYESICGSSYQLGKLFQRLELTPVDNIMVSQNDYTRSTDLELDSTYIDLAMNIYTELRKNALD